MPSITYVATSGATTRVDAEDSANVMQAAVAHGVDGIVGECGGSMMCATCHVYIDEAFADRTGPRSEGEEEMLEGAVSEIRPSSRLSCQIAISKELDGLVVHLPPRQI